MTFDWYLLDMKISFSNIKEYFTEEQIEVIKKFISFLQKSVPLDKNVKMYFLGERKEHMTTGARFPHHKLYILSKNRLLIDVLRTIVHEWIHEFEHQKLGVSEKKKVKNIGSPEENLSNILSGIFLKKFDKKFPKFRKEIYGEK